MLVDTAGLAPPSQKQRSGPDDFLRSFNAAVSGLDTVCLLQSGDELPRLLLECRRGASVVLVHHTWDRGLWYATTGQGER